MYRMKPTHDSPMPAPQMPIRVVVLNASLKHADTLSNTGELAAKVVEEMRRHGGVESDEVRLSDLRIPVGLAFREGDDDDWPAVVAKLRAADIVIFATPIWWGGRSSLMQRVIERLDSLDEEYIATGRSALYNKVAGVVITGSEDGAQAVLGSILEVLTFMCFTLPPECCAYWVGEVGRPVAEETAARRINAATKHMAMNMARNLMFYAQLLKMHPLVVGEGQAAAAGDGASGH
jgi:multimeric flavodoxin WrbA